MKNEGSELLPRLGWPELWRRLPRVALPALGDLLLALVYGLFVRISIGATVRGDVGALILWVQELSIVILVLTRRRAAVAVAGDSPPAILAWCGTILPLLLRPTTLAPIPIVILGNVLQLIGGLLVLVATLRLGRSFGIVAANRGIQTGGLYRVVRKAQYRWLERNCIDPRPPGRTTTTCACLAAITRRWISTSILITVEGAFPISELGSSYGNRENMR